METSSFDSVLVIDYGAQYAQLIARRVRECKVFSEILPHDVSIEEIRKRRSRGLILSGGPASVYAPGAPAVNPWAGRRRGPISPAAIGCADARGCGSYGKGRGGWG